MQKIQADILGVDVVKPVVSEITGLGAAYAAGLGVGFWKDPADLQANWGADKRVDADLERRSAGWRKAVQRTLDWVDVD
jgi:glycerol kinase